MAEPLRVLVVEDSEDDTRFLVRELERASYDVSWERVETAGAMRSALEERSWDLVVADYTMPKFSAPSALALLQNMGLDLPFIIVSGSVGEDIAVKAMRAGAHDYLLKGNLKRLFPAIERELEQAEQRRARRKAEEAIKSSEQSYRSLFESMLHGVAHCEMVFENGEPRDYVYLDVNEQFEVLTGLKDVVGRRATEVIPGIRESSPELIQVCGRVALTGIPERFEVYVETLGIWLSISAYSPQKGHFVALFENVTEQKRAQDNLRRSEERRRALMEHALDAILVLSPDGTILEANRAAETLVGRPRGEQIGRSFLELLPAEERDAVAGRLGTMIETGFFHDSSSVLRTDGRTVPVEVSASRVDVGREPLVLAIVRDVSDRWQLEGQLRQAQKMEAVGQLAGGVAHDFNNLLTVILGYSDVLAEKLGSRSLRFGELDEIRAAGERAASLTRQLLAFSRQQVLERKVLDVNALIAHIERMMRRLIGEDVDLVTVLSPALRRVSADAGQLEQVVMNLAVNARDAMLRGGRLTIETANVELDEAYARQHVTVRPGSYVMIAVSDTGIGMNGETLAHMFEPFFTTKGPGKGTGLGLATVYGIVKQSGGYIWVYSEVGKGTTFKIYLPLVEEGVEVEPVSASEPISLAGSETVLLVEDERSVRMLSRTVLKSYGYTVLEAASGKDGLDVARQYPLPIHLLLTDVVMPEMGGPDLASRLETFRPGVRVLYMSGYTDDAVFRHGLLEKGRVFLQKPFTPENLARKVREALGG